MLQPGTQLGPYEIVSLLGVGGMGEVYRARDIRLGRSVALKVLPPDVSADTSRRLRFEQEARAASALNHPNILSVFDTGSHDGLAYIVSELIDGESLRDLISRGPLPQSRAVEIASQVADALAAAHAASIVHRDLKPENIMLTRDGRAKVLDFGLAKQITNAAAADDSDATKLLTRTSPGAILGTTAYMSPEQVMAGELDGRSDIFSFGLVLHESLTGQQTFRRATPVEVMTAILREDPPELPETIAPALRQIVAHCLEKEPERRFHSARDLAFALRTVTTTSSGSRAGGRASIVPTSHPRRWLWPAIAIALAAGLAALVVASFLSSAAIDLASYRFTPFANDHEPESDAAWSPDGKSIAYLKTVEGIPQLMVRALDSATPIQLSKSREPVSHTFWSPDSTLIYYTLNAGKGALWAVSPSGGRPAHILDDLRTAAISPDGKTLTLWRATENAGAIQSSLWLSSPPGSPPRPYPSAPFSIPLDSDGNSLSFSPDGNSILLITAGITPTIWLLPFPETRGTPRRLFAATEFNWVPRAGWMPDSRRAMLSFSTVAGQPALWLADLKTEKLRRLTASAGSEEGPSVSPDGRRMAFTSATDDYDLIELPLDGSKSRTLLANSRNMYSPSWSPAGDQFLYATDRDGASEIWVHNIRASIDRPLVTHSDFPAGTTSLSHPVFSPDGSRFAFVRSSTTEPTTIWVEPSVGGAPIRLAAEYLVAPTWSPDGNSIAGLMHRERPWQPAIIGVGANMTPHVIPGAPTCLMPLEWSPKGDWLACEARDGIQLFSPDGSRRRTLPRLNSNAIAFSRDGATLFAAGRNDGRTFLKAIDLATGAVRDIATLAGSLTVSGGATYRARLSLSPDGKSLATSAVETKSDLWILEGYPLK
jgi:Tol biopolymer transport system component